MECYILTSYLMGMVRLTTGWQDTPCIARDFDNQIHEKYFKIVKLAEIKSLEIHMLLKKLGNLLNSWSVTIGEIIKM